MKKMQQLRKKRRICCSSFSNSFHFQWLHFYFIQFKIYFPFIIITKYWLYSTCCTVYHWVYLIPNSLYLTLPHSYTAPPSPLGTTGLFFISERLLLLFLYFFFLSFFTSLYFLDSTCKWYNTVFVFIYLTYFTQNPSMLLQGVKCHSFFMAE